jgi:hypothetical protein
MCLMYFKKIIIQTDETSMIIIITPEHNYNHKVVKYE